MTESTDATSQGAEHAEPGWKGKRSDRTMRGQLPNGVVRSSRASDSPAGMESLPYSPAALPHNREATAVLGSAETRYIGDVPAALRVRWMQRLGDFFRQHPAMETFTTMTRQQFVELIRPCLEGKREGQWRP